MQRGRAAPGQSRGNKQLDRRLKRCQALKERDSASRPPEHPNSLPLQRAGEAEEPGRSRHWAYLQFRLISHILVKALLPRQPRSDKANRQIDQSRL
jgi:hypothetical protein